MQDVEREAGTAADGDVGRITPDTAFRRRGATVPAQQYRQALQEIARLEQQRQKAEAQLQLTRASASFRLGQLLIRSLRRPLQVFRLPRLLFDIYREARQRQRPRRRPLLRPRVPDTRRRPARPAAPRLLRPVTQAGQLRQLRVAAILDDFSAQSFAPECRLLQLSPTDWQQQCAAFEPDLLLVESAWQGAHGAWQGKISHAARELQELVAWCRQQQVPTVFWNKEDPIHFATFITTAALFDYVATTDIDCISRYKAVLGHDDVVLLPFAAQPALHHPLERYERKDAFCFAGAYYARYPERIRDLSTFVWELADYRPLEIFDRNFGTSDAKYRFPPEYRPFIVGTLPYAEIDWAYKGYRYAINLNSIKQSQSMFARRVFELLASNTITLSNYSRGLRLLFGDLVLSSDSGNELLRRLELVNRSEVDSRRFRLAGLRRVLGEHTYQDRLAYLVSRLQDAPLPPLLPTVTLIGRADDAAQLTRLLEAYRRQRYAQRRLQLAVPDALLAAIPPTPDITLVPLPDGVTLADWLPDADWLAGLVVQDEYGPDYLTDLVLAVRFSTADVIGKAASYGVVDGAIRLSGDGLQYREAEQLPARAALVRAAAIGGQDAADWLHGLAERTLQHTDGLTLCAIDAFNYCRDGADLPQAASAVTSDIAGLDTGLPLSGLLAAAERITADTTATDDGPVWGTDALAELFRAPTDGSVRITREPDGLRVASQLEDGSHAYLYARYDYTPHELGMRDTLRAYLETTPGLQVQLVVRCLDRRGQTITSLIQPANHNVEQPLPAGTAKLCFGLRIYAGGVSELRGLLLGRHTPQAVLPIRRSEFLLLTNHYPSADDLYRNAFVHSRVRAYAARGTAVDVVRLRHEPITVWHEHEGIDVTSTDAATLQRLLAEHAPRCVLVHFLDEAMWQVLQHYRGRIVVWLHGAEIHAWHRRSFNLQTPGQRERAQQQGERRMAFWRGLLRTMPDNLQLVFVSRSFADEVMQDLGFRLPEERCRIIHNPIDTELFAYVPKPPTQRLKILSIRPYVSRQYANDLAVAAIVQLSREPFFKELEFRLIGDGELFEETVAPLRGYRNVTIERGFLTQPEIAALHREYGVFLVPTRWDSQGVSRDEAMSSGLVPVTTATAAVPEFVDQTCGLLAPVENAAAIAQALVQLYRDPQLFLRLSQNAAARVRDVSAAPLIIAQELALIGGAARAADARGETQ